MTPGTGSGAQFSYAGSTYLSGDYTTSRYNHLMPPNTLSVVVPIAGSDLAASINGGAQATTASSGHPGGVNLVLADGSLRFVRNGIEIHAWWALGSIAGGETLQEAF
ncbi:MAG: H-X9-DG-CTERM domain-containing protein [Thermoguttaceae bacterium]